MALIKKLNGISPEFGENIFLADNATVIGNVSIGDNCSVWFNAVIRGDVHYVKIGNNVNIQDGVVIHATFKRSPVNIGNNVSIAHNAVVHGCTVHDNVLIGIGAIILDNVVINTNSIIAAGSVVLENTIIEGNSVYAGIPAKKVKTITDNLITDKIQRISNSYSLYSSWYKDEDKSESV